MDEPAFYRSAPAYDAHYQRLGEADIHFWQTLAEQLGAGRILELGCGSGRVTLPLARWLAPRGGRIVGLDAAPAMLAGAEAKLAAEPAAVRAATRLVQADMRGFALDERFDLIAIPFNTLAHLHSIEDQLACLVAARRHLAPGGRFAVDVSQPTLAELYQGVTRPDETHVDSFAVDKATGRRLVRYRRVGYDHASQTTTIRFAYEWMSERGELSLERTTLSLHVFFRRELELLFRLAGYQVEAAYSGYAFAPPEEPAPQLIMIGVAGEGSQAGG